MPTSSENASLAPNNAKAYGLSAICFVLAMLVLGLDMSIPLGVAVAVLYTLVVWISFRSPQRSFTIWIATLCTLLTLAAALHQTPIAEMWKVAFNRMLSIIVIWMTALLGLKWKKSEEMRELALRDREKALEETRVLRGMLPICSSCKKIRDDEGYWTQMEAYIRDHSEAEFTHGLCPDCAQKLYGDYINQSGKK